MYLYLFHQQLRFWIHSLHSSDTDEIMNGDGLTVKHVNAVEKLLQKKQFPTYRYSMGRLI
jgi:hypothetical protein